MVGFHEKTLTCIGRSVLAVFVQQSVMRVAALLAFRRTPAATNGVDQDD